MPKDNSKKSNSCPKCKYKSSDEQYLKRHIARHDIANRPFKCDQCDFATCHPSMLKMHKNRHSGERPYVCETCGASFSYASNCQRHKASHKMEKRHKCDRCSYAANQLVSIRTHQESFKGVLFACSLCAFKSCTRSLILKHMREAHGITEANVTGLDGELEVNVDGEEEEDEGGVSYMDEENNVTIHEDGDKSIMIKPLNPSYVSPLQAKSLNTLTSNSSNWNQSQLKLRNPLTVERACAL